MTISRTKLGAAIRSKFKSPRDLLRHLGIDQDLAAVGQPGASGGSPDQLQQFRAAIEENLSGHDDERFVARMLAICDEFAPTDRVDASDPNAARAAELAGHDGDNLENVERMRSALRNAGMNSDDIDAALAAILRDGVPIGDKLPVPALFGRGLGGRRSGDFREPEALAGDGHFGAGRIRVGYDYGPARNRALPIKLTERGIEDYNKRFGGEHIVNG